MLQKNDLDHSLALELFHRTSATALVGLVGVGIMVYPHMATEPWQHYVAWAVPMFLVIFVRAIFGMYASEALKADRMIERFVNFETFLCGLTGVSWARSLYMFDSGAMDQAFYFRLMILSSTLALILPSTTMFLRHFLAYALPIASTVIIHFVAHGYVQPLNIFLTCTILYLGMIGVLAVLTNRRGRASVADHLAATRLADELRGVLQSERELHDSIGRSTLTDELTGIYNRRGILNTLAREMAHCKRSGRPIAVLVIDIDNLGRINERFSYGNGDRVLCTVSMSMMQALRDTDVLGRVDGGRFLAVLRELECRSAVTAADRVRQQVARDPIALSGRLVQVTVSTGIALYRSEDDAEVLLARANTALHSAKIGGRNRIEVDALDAVQA